MLKQLVAPLVVGALTLSTLSTVVAQETPETPEPTVVVLVTPTPVVVTPSAIDTLDQILAYQQITAGSILIIAPVLITLLMLLFFSGRK